MTALNPDLIIPTKLLQPPLRAGVVTRERLNEKLTSSLSKRLTLISAPAGFGKTTLTLSWLKQLNKPVSWISLDTQDSNPARFFTYLAAAISQTNPELRDYFAEKMNSQTSGPVKNMAELLLHEVSVLSPFTVIVLDDYHCIADPKIHEAMCYLLQNLPHDPVMDPSRGCHFIILTRNDPPFPISKWRLADEITEIRASDLRFSPSETKQILTQAMNINLSTTDIQTLSERTEGWVAGLQMAAISLNGLESNQYSQYIQQIKGNNNLIADYLVEEVFSQLDPVTQSFLLQTSILERMSGPLCVAVTLMNGCQEILQTLEKKNVLVMPLDNERGWYRYHQLFSDVLMNRLMNESDYSIEQLHTRAAMWFEQNGIIEDSLKHWMKIGRYDEVARIIADLSPGMMSRAQYFLLSNIIESFSDEAFQIYPWLSIYLAWAYTFIEPESVVAWLLLAEKVLEKPGTRELYSDKEIKEMYGDVATIKAVLASRKGDFLTVAKYAPIALKLLPKDKKKVRGLVLYSIATDQYISSHLDNAVASYSEAFELLLQDRNLAGCVIVSLKYNEILINQGKLHDAEKALKQAIALDHFYPGKELSMSCCLCAVYGKLLYEWNQLDAAVEYLNLGIEKSKRVGISERVFVAAASAEVWLGLGEIDKAEQILRDYIHLWGDPSLTLWDENHLIASWMVLLVLQGRKTEYSYLVRKQHDILQGPIDAINEPVFIAYAYSNYLLGEFDKAVDIAENLERMMVSSGRIGSQIKMLALIAASKIALSEMDMAFSALSRGIQLGAREGYIRTFLEFGEPAMDAINLLVKSGRVNDDHLDVEYIAEIQDGFIVDRYSTDSRIVPKTKLQHSSDLKSEMLLTDHEKKVLRLLIAGHNNKEISQELCISVNTVKTHIANIYGKLNVHNRFQASIRVRQLGISLIQ